MLFCMNSFILIKKDHGKAFWIEMDKLVGDGKKMASRLKKYDKYYY